MHALFDQLSRMIRGYPRLVAGTFLLLVVVALFGTTLITMQTGTDTYLEKGTERWMLLDTYTRTFQSDSIMLLVEADDVLDPEVLAYVDAIEQDVAREQYVTGTSSIVNLLRDYNGGRLPANSAEIARIKAEIPADIRDRYLPSGTMLISVLTLETGLEDSQQYNLLSSISSRVGMSDRPPGVGIIITGNPAFSQQMSEEMGESMGTLILAAMVLMVIAVGLLFGHVRYRLLSVFIVGTGLILTFGFIGITGIPITMVTIGAFPVMIGIGIDYAIQFHQRFDEEARRSPLLEAVTTTITKAGPSVMYALIATAMGFIALTISPLPMVRSFGVVCVIGLAFCYLSSIVIVPTFGFLTGYRPVAGPGGPDSKGEKTYVERFNAMVGRLVGFVARHPVPVLLLCVLVAVIGFQMDNEIIVNTDEKTFVPADMPAKVNLDKVRRTMGETSTLPLLVRGDNVLSAESLVWMDEFQQYEDTHNSKITGSSSIATLMKRYNNGMLPTDAPDIRAVLARIPEAVKSRYFDGKMVAVIEFSMVDMPNDVAMTNVDRMQKDLAWKSPPAGISASFTGQGEMFTNFIREIRNGKTQMTLLGFGFILVFLYSIYRKPVKAATPLVPIVMIVGWNGLIMYLLGIDYTPLTATLGSMSVGVASEYTILIMERYYEERANGLPLMEAIRHSVQQIGTAITVSGMTTVFGFAALTISAFGIISNFGTVTVISVFFALAGAIGVMPAILVLVGRLERGEVPDSGTASRLNATGS